jgi:hypothetical protein
MRELIISEIRRLAASNGGVPPGEQRFGTATGIAHCKWKGLYWVRWSEALVEAGFPPNGLSVRLDSNELLLKVAAFCRELGRFPSHYEIRIQHRADPAFPGDTTLRRHFGGRSRLAAALRRLALADPGWADLLDLVPEKAKVHAPSAARALGPAPAPPPRRRQGLVYLLKSGRHYKIGQSRDIERRFRAIEVALPEPVTLIHTIGTDDPRGIEAYWHRRFAERRANGEWFALGREDVKAFLRRTYQ